MSTPNDSPMGSRFGGIVPVFERSKFPEVVPGDLDCSGCGYNLRGLATSGTCPECAAPIWLAYSGAAVLMADPQWLRRLVCGTRFLNAAGAVFLAAAGAVVIVFQLLGIDIRGVWLLAACVSVLLALVGVYFITSRNPATRSPTMQTPAFRARVGMFVSVAGLIAMAVWRVNFGWTGGIVAIMAVASPIGLSGWYGLRELTIYFDGLLREIGDDFLAGRAVRYRQWLNWCGGLLGVAHILGFMFGGAGLCIGVVPGAVYLGVAVLTLTLPASLSSDLRECQQHAQRFRENRDYLP